MSIGRYFSSLILAAAMVTLSSAPLFATLTLPNLPPGTKYEIIFATSLQTTGSSSLISTYNTLAADSAALDSLLPGGVTWSAVASTLTTAASANAPSSGIPIYNTHGTEVSAGNLYSGSLLAPVSFDENGNMPPTTLTWTGATSAGGISANPLGSSLPEFGESDQSSSTWITGLSGDSPSIIWPVYALSSPITVVPEPGTLSLLAVAIAGFGGIFFSRRRANVKA